VNPEVDSYSPGGLEEATLYVAENYSLWHSIPGAVSWLNYTKARCGIRPDEQTLIRLLRKEVVMVVLAKQYRNRFIYGTQRCDRMVGSALPEFRLRKELTVPHNDGFPIYVQEHALGKNVEDLWRRFLYVNVDSVPFWNVLLGYQEKEVKEEVDLAVVDEKNEDFSNARRCYNCEKSEPTVKLQVCSKCKVATYCSPECQTKHWKIHKRECKNLCKNRKIPWGELDAHSLSIISSYLNLKEKAVVSSLNKVWQLSFTSDRAVSVNPDVVGPDINSVLAFVGSQFQHLQDFSMYIDQGYFLQCNDEPLLQLHGYSLSNFFAVCPALRSVDIFFDTCCVKQVFQIVQEESCFDTLSQHKSMESLRVSNLCLKDIKFLSDMIGLLKNLKKLSLNDLKFDNYEGYDDDRWGMGGWDFDEGLNMGNTRLNGEISEGDSWSKLMPLITKMKNLCRLSLADHGLVDKNFKGLTNTFQNLTSLNLEGRFGSNNLRDTFLTDNCLKFISKCCPKLHKLEISYNRHFTINGIVEVLKMCPLRLLTAHNTGIFSIHLELIVSISSKLRLLRYGWRPSWISWISWIKPPT